MPNRTQIDADGVRIRIECEPACDGRTIVIAYDSFGRSHVAGFVKQSGVRQRIRGKLKSMWAFEFGPACRDLRPMDDERTTYNAAIDALVRIWWQYHQKRLDQIARRTDAEAGVSR